MIVDVLYGIMIALLGIYNFALSKIPFSLSQYLDKFQSAVIWLFSPINALAFIFDVAFFWKIVILLLVFEIGFWTYELALAIIHFAKLNPQHPSSNKKV